MRHIQTVFLLCAALWVGLTFSGCGSDEPDTPEPRVELTPGANTDIVLGYLDNTVVGEFKFNAIGDWATEIFETDASFQPVSGGKKPEWIATVPFQGSTGLQTPQLFVSPNRSTDARYAVVRVNSVTNYIEFRITQKGMPAGGGADTPIPNPE